MDIAVTGQPDTALETIKVHSLMVKSYTLRFIVYALNTKSYDLKFIKIPDSVYRYSRLSDLIFVLGCTILKPNSKAL